MLEFLLALLLMEVSASTHFLNSIIYLYQLSIYCAIQEAFNNMYEVSRQ